MGAPGEELSMVACVLDRYIKFIAAFFNLEQTATQHFDSTVAAYTAYAAQSNGPKVAWIQWNSWTNKFEVSLVAYKSQLVSAAGGQNVDGSALEAAGMEATDAVSGNPLAGKTYSLAANATTMEAMANQLMSALRALDSQRRRAAAVLSNSSCPKVMWTLSSTRNTPLVQLPTPSTASSLACS